MLRSRTPELACLVDTDVAVDFLRRRAYARNVLERWSGEGRVAVSVFTHIPLLTNNVRYYPFPRLNIVRGLEA